MCIFGLSPMEHWRHSIRAEALDMKRQIYLLLLIISVACTLYCFCFALFGIMIGTDISIPGALANARRAERLWLIVSAVLVAAPIFCAQRLYRLKKKPHCRGFDVVAPKTKSSDVEEINTI